MSAALGQRPVEVGIMRFVNNFKTAMLLGLLMALCIAVGYWVTGGRPEGVLFGFLFGALGNVIAFFFSDKIALAAMRAQEVTRDQAPELYDIVEDLAGRAGLPMPRIYVCPQPAPNAFATGRSPSHAAVAITDSMLRNFPRHEIEGVLAHELSHVKHRDVLISTVAAVMAGMISALGYVLMFGGGRGRDNPLGAIGLLAMIILAPLAAALIQAAISRQREFAADSYGGELCGDPLKLAGALARLGRANERVATNTNPAFHNLYIVEPLSGGGIVSLFSTHPPLEQRIAALQEQARTMR
jgi:heat shock protein HtpX